MLLHGKVLRLHSLTGAEPWHIFAGCVKWLRRLHWSTGKADMFIYLSKKIAIPNNVRLRCLSWNTEQVSS